MARFGPFSNSAFFILCGPGVRGNYRRPRAALSVDVAPTLASLFGIPVPRNADGKLLVDALEEFSP
jgi:arylsulfatase A-like enzyme